MTFKLLGRIAILLIGFAVLLCEADSINSPKKLVAQLSDAVKSIAPLEQSLQLNNNEGSFLGWVHLDESQSSRTLMSARWSEDIKAPSYMVLSDGWWEHANTHGLYFVVDNKQFAFCYIDKFSVPSNKWVFLTVTWGQHGQQGYCQIYIDGQIYTEKKISIKIKKNTNLMHPFSDDLTDNPKQRFPSGLTSGLFHYSSMLSWKDILSIYNATKMEFKNKEIVAKKNSVENSFLSFEQRVLFDEDIYWALSKKNTDEVLKKVERGNFNVFIPCVWHGQGAHFKNSKKIYDPRVKSRIESGDDPLAYLLLQAGKKKIKVIPWFTVVLREGKYLPEFADAGIEGAFNVHNPFYRDFISSLIYEAINSYGLESVNLDYIRSMGVCLTKKCQEDFALQYNKSLSAEMLRSKNENIYSESISAWNRSAVEEIIRKVRTNIASKKSFQLSIDAIPLNKELAFQGQESISWLNTGLVDTVFSMNYQRNIDIKEMLSASEKVNRGKIIPIISTYDRVLDDFVSRDTVGMQDNINNIKNYVGNNGIAFYNREMLTENQMLYFNH